MFFFIEFKFIYGQVARIFVNKRAALRETQVGLTTGKVNRLQPERMANKQKQAHTRNNAMIDQIADTFLQDSTRSSKDE